MPGGALPAGEAWVKAVYGWGYFTVQYGLQSTVPCDWACYVGVAPFAISTGTAYPGRVNLVTHSVVVYGDIWLRGHSAGSYGLIPQGPPVQQGQLDAPRRGPLRHLRREVVVREWPPRTNDSVAPSNGDAEI